MATLSPEQTEQVRQLRARNVPQQVLADTFGVSRRQIIKATRGATPERLAREQPKLSARTVSIRESFKRNAREQGLSTRIRGNERFNEFNRQIQIQDKLYEQVREGMMSRKEWVAGRLSIYLKNGLITQEQYEAYLQGIK